jgi:hypothetical protein
LNLAPGLSPQAKERALGRSLSLAALGEATVISRSAAQRGPMALPVRLALSPARGRENAPSVPYWVIVPLGNA